MPLNKRNQRLHPIKSYSGAGGPRSPLRTTTPQKVRHPLDLKRNSPLGQFAGTVPTGATAPCSHRSKVFVLSGGKHVVFATVVSSHGEDEMNHVCRCPDERLPGILASDSGWRLYVD